MASGITPLQRLQHNADRVDLWIAENKPSPAKSQKIFTAFMDRYGSTITGSDAFVETTTKIIQETSCLAAGATIMERLLSTGRNMPICEGKSSCFESNSETNFVTLHLDVSRPKRTYTCVDSQGDRRFAEERSLAVTFIHEALHAWHEFVDGPAHRIKARESGCLPDMDSAEEELAITGNLHLDAAENADFCCENTALQELNCPPRINHRGVSSEVPDLHDLVDHRILPTIRELFQQGQISHETKDGTTPLERAFGCFSLENDPQGLHECMSVIRILIQSGGQSDSALKMAILHNSEELIALLLEAGVPLTEEMLTLATKETPDRLDEMWNMLQKTKLVITDEMIEDIGKMPSVMLPGADWNDSPIVKAMRKRAAQFESVKAKFSDDGTLPAHTLRILFYLRDLKPGREAFREWNQVSSYRAPRLPRKAPLPPKPQAAEASPHAEEAVIACVSEQRSTTFEFTADGACVPSRDYQDFHPGCYKSFEVFEHLPWFSSSSPFFTQREIETFLQVLDIHHINSMAGSFGDRIMEELKIGYIVERREVVPASPNAPMPVICNYVSRDYELSRVFAGLITTQMSTALSTPGALSDGTNAYYVPTYYFDIPIISEEGTALFQQIKHEFDGKYLDAIESVKNEVVCRVLLKEHLQSTACRLHFACEILIDGKSMVTFG